jgi:glutamine amidotransferase
MSSSKLTIVDYGMGNIWSVESAMRFLNVQVDITSDPEVISKSECIILPGVGSFKEAMDALKISSLDEALSSARNKGSKILGICLGMQLLGLSSTEEGLTNGLNFFEREVEYFSDDNDIKVPHIGFNSVYSDKSSRLFKEIDHGSDFYFVHSFRMKMNNGDVNHSYCEYGEKFLSSFESENIFGTQFHPEKSQTNGIKLLQNFLKI